jgi:V8-like Glu-specific endopeptidase
MRRLSRWVLLSALLCLISIASVDLHRVTARPDPRTIYTSDGQILPAARLSDLGWPSLAASETLFSPPSVPPGLPVADDASPPHPQVIIGSDGRTRVSNTAIYPYSAVVYIEFTRPLGDRGRCTGFFYAANAIATVAHCLYVIDGTSPRG